MNVVITGGNRGIGLALTKQYKARGAKVFATCRNSCDELNSAGVTIVKGVDVSQPDTLAEKLAPLMDINIDILINNAGVLGRENIEDWDPNTIDYQFRVNALGPLLVTQTLLPRLAEQSKVALISSRMGSMEDNGSGGYYGYRMSKAALNAAGVSMANDLRPKGIAVGVFHPGFVQTEMVNGAGDIDADTCAERLVARIDELNIENAGRFIHSNGDVLPW
ncbi:short-chain dehydrogenase [Alteromonas sp. KC3]|jgi:NAD(P)-dependent dehydrogenase (short-subunit alcohol dehydrogenase family)|uniref:SDR family oxidoreductase n=1 Tax=unclassified Alteromonas TaxID=2614992 RepID=UPI0019207D8C|nr:MULTISPECIES: SDR family oxidoreductase [unclassified Alteromonas]BCO19249.1 short-chain dehydrogenase [Alteromonas sp. KC3]BCO23209.1 short-chain dehydrogenase [Alteromonas sp. KC14]